jgi:hypothetical protein
MTAAFLSLFVSANLRVPAGGAPTATSADANTQCIGRLLVPEYPPLARATVSSGTLKVVITLDEKGAIKSQKFEVLSNPKNAHLLQPAIERAVKASTFNDACHGQSVWLIFRFKIASDNAVWFEPPATYEIDAQAPPINTARPKR